MRHICLASSDLKREEVEGKVENEMQLSEYRSAGGLSAAWEATKKGGRKQSDRK